MTNEEPKRTFTSFLMHHVLLSTVISDAIDGEIRRMMLAKWRLKSPKQRISFFSVFHNWPALFNTVTQNTADYRMLLTLQHNDTIEIIT